MKASDVIRGWGNILSGRAPSLSIEITRECPLRCPGCYAYDDNHLGGLKVLRDLNDSKGDALIQGVLRVVDERKPLHLSIVGGDPLVRYREVEALIPQLIERGVHVQLVTSAFRPMHESWGKLEHLNVVVSIDGLQPEHDERRKPATYDRILKNIVNQQITIHCTITSQMVKRPGYIREFLEFWTPRPEIRKVWFSIFTPQIGAEHEEILTQDQRRQVVEELKRLRVEFPKLDMPVGMLDQFLSPPHSPDDCIFAMTTETISADLTTRITPCQFGGEPDCSQCGCIASMGLAAVGAHKLGGFLPVGAIFRASHKVGKVVNSLRSSPEGVPAPAQGDAR